MKDYDSTHRSINLVDRGLQNSVVCQKEGDVLYYTKSLPSGEAALDLLRLRLGQSDSSIIFRSETTRIIAQSDDPCKPSSSEGTVRSGGQVEQHRHRASPWAAVNLAQHSIFFLPRPIAVTTVSI